MEIKKTPEADLENKRFTWLLMGYVVVLAIGFVMFEWSTGGRDAEDMDAAVSDLVFEEDIAPVTLQQMEELLLPPLPETVPSVQSENIQVVDDTTEVKDVDFASMEKIPELPEVNAVPEKMVETTSEENVYEYVEKLPEFPNGGQSALRRYLSKNIRYPDDAQQKGIQGCVVCQFIVDKDGTIADVRIVQSVSASIDQEAVRVVAAMPKWEPGILQGKPVRVRFTLPIMFRL